MIKKNSVCEILKQLKKDVQETENFPASEKNQIIDSIDKLMVLKHCDGVRR